MIKEGLQYTRDHDWIEQSGDVYTVGITDYAQDALGDIVFINLPEVGDSFSAGDVVCDIESVKAVSDVLAPVSGTVTEINETLLDAPETINSAPYDAWLFKMDNVTDTDELIDAKAYEAVTLEGS